jgi:hypothetical protein
VKCKKRKMEDGGGSKEGADEGGEEDKKNKEEEGETQKCNKDDKEQRKNLVRSLAIRQVVPEDAQEIAETH